MFQAYFPKLTPTWIGILTGAGVLVIAVLWGWVTMILTRTTPELLPKPESITTYDIEGTPDLKSWALCRSGDGIVRGACLGTESGQETVSELLLTSGRFGWGCASNESVRALVSCLGSGNEHHDLSMSVSSMTSAWSLMSQPLGKLGMTMDYYQWRNALDSCLDEVEPEDEY